MSHCYQWEKPSGLKGAGRAGGISQASERPAGAPRGRTGPRAWAAGRGRGENIIPGHNALPSYSNDSGKEMSFQNSGDRKTNSTGRRRPVSAGGCARADPGGRTDRQTDTQTAGPAARRQHPASPDTHAAGPGRQRPQAPERGPFPPPGPGAGVPTPPRGTYTSVLLREEIWAVVRAFLLGGEAAAARAAGTAGQGRRQGGREETKRTG